MKKALFLSFLFSILLAGTNSAQTHTFVRNGCANSATVTIDSSFFIVSRLYTLGPEVNCPMNPSNFDYRLQGVEIPAVRFILQVRSGLNSWSNVPNGTAEFSQNSYQFNYPFSQGSTYRVRIEIRQVMNNTFAISQLEGCTIVGNVLPQPNSSIVQFSEELEFIDSPVPSVTLIDVFGTPGNGFFCVGDPVFMNAAASFGETSYIINMSMFDPTRTTELAWTSCGSYTGQIGDFINVLDLWQTNFPNWDFWPNFSYRIHIVYQNSCNTWLNFFVFFNVVETGCRTSELEPTTISIYPNPTSDEIKFKGLEAMGGGAQYQVVSLSSGRLEKQGHLPNSPMPIDVRELENGLYIIRMEMDGRVFTEKFSVLR